MIYEYTYRCVCECKFQIQIKMRREIDFDVLCLRTDCDLIMNPILESKEPLNELFESQVDFE